MLGNRVAEKEGKIDLDEPGWRWENMLEGKSCVSLWEEEQQS